MALITQHVPELFEGYYVPIVAEFNTQEELLEVGFVKIFRLTFEGEPDGYFHQYSLDDDKLIVETNGGKFGYVIGYIDDTQCLNLPKWENNEENSEKS